MSYSQVMLLLQLGAPNDSEVFNVPNQEIHYIKGGFVYNQVGDNGEK